METLHVVEIDRLLMLLAGEVAHIFMRGALRLRGQISQGRAKRLRETLS
jgi:hypothetical protein